MKRILPLLCAASVSLAATAAAQLKPITREEIAIGSQQYLPSQPWLNANALI